MDVIGLRIGVDVAEPLLDDDKGLWVCDLWVSRFRSIGFVGFWVCDLSNRLGEGENGRKGKRGERREPEKMGEKGKEERAGEKGREKSVQ